MSSLKIERDTFQRDLAAPSGVAPKGGPLPGTSGKHPVAEAVGTAITGGKGNAGTKGYLRVTSTPRRHAVLPLRENQSLAEIT